MRSSAAIALLSLLPLTAALADVYRSVDAQGHVLYSDTPTPGAQLVVRSSSSQRLSSAASLPASASASKAAPLPALLKTDEPPHDQVTQQAAARSVQNDVAQTRAEQCKKAQEAYQKSVTARRIYNVGPNGERQYLTDDEADQARVNNKLAMDEFCKDVVSAAQ